MNPKNPTVLIPLVDLGAGGNDTFLEIYSTRKHDADADKKAWIMALDPVVAPLFPFSLYTMGLSALSRVRKYGLRKPFAALYQKFNPQAALNQQRLHCATPIAAKIDGESGELGMALCLMMGATQSPHSNIIATGRLTPKLDGEAEYQNTHDAKVYPISGLEKKLRLVKKNAEKNSLNHNTRYFFIPEVLHDGTLVKDDETIQALIKDLQALNIEVKAVACLSDAAKVLRVEKTRHLWGDLIINFVLAITITLGGGWSAYEWWKGRKIELEFLPADEVTTPETAPFEACLQDIVTSSGTDIGMYDKVFPLERGEYKLTIPSKSILGWKLKIKNINLIDEWLYKYGFFKGYYVAQLRISEIPLEKLEELKSKINIKIGVPEIGQKPLRFAQGEIWEGAFRLNVSEGLYGIILLIQRHPFNKMELRNQLIEFSKKIDDQILDATFEFTEKHFSGFQAFTVKTMDTPSKCED